ncbi:MAG: DUF2760 domain-containing protein [Desulfobacteraceae bacterium]
MSKNKVDADKVEGDMGKTVQTDMKQSHARRSFLIVFLFIIFLAGIVNAALYYGINGLLSVLPPALGAESEFKTVSDLAGIFRISDTAELTALLSFLAARFFQWVVPAVSVFFVFFALVLWLVLKSAAAFLFKDKQTGEDAPEARQTKKDGSDRRMEQERNRRLFLHFLSVLQREGRLMDFFNEDLDLYEDDQIGAAVRSIHEDCKGAVNKYLAPKPVIDREEGDEVDVEPGFDPDAVKLIGNVKGDPPFKGILRHRGWKAGRNELPKLSDVKDASIIVPAEVEIQ